MSPDIEFQRRAPRTILVTGATGNVGFGIVEGFLRAGDRVVVHGKHHDELDAAAERLRVAFPDRHVDSVAFDLAVPAEIDAGFARLDDAGIALDVLVNNAAHLGMDDGAVAVEQRALIRSVFDVNVFGLHSCSVLAAARMAERDGGVIVNVSSLGGSRAIHGRTSYNASKGAIDALTRSMALEWIDRGVRINAIAPGYIETERWAAISPEVADRRRRNIPLGRPTTIPEIFDLVSFLASSASASIVGEVMNVDGGMGSQQLPRDVML